MWFGHTGHGPKQSYTEDPSCALAVSPCEPQCGEEWQLPDSEIAFKLEKFGGHKREVTLAMMPRV